MSINPTNYSEWTEAKAPDPCEVLSHPYPFTTYHEMSLGWFLQQWKEFLTDFEKSKEAIEGITADAETVPYTEPATVTITGGENGTPYHLHFKIPQGEPAQSAGGNVKSVNNVEPDESGNVTLTAADVHALAVSGGDLVGAINMNGHPISGLNDPTDNTQATRKGYVDAIVQKFPLENLLDNWYFANPVNQRGKTSYTGSYAIDRWKVHNNVTLTIASENIEISGNTGNPVYQVIENGHLLNGSTLTFSTLAKGNIRITITKITGSTTTHLKYKTFDTNGIWDVVSITASISGLTSTDQLRVCFYMGTADTPVSIFAAKLELSSAQTLAHQENGVWILNEIPDYGEQLARCQRYQQWLPVAPSTNALGMGVAISRTSIRMAIPLAAPMRDKPSIEYVVGNVSQMVLVGNGTSLVPTAVSVELNDAYMPSFIFTVENAAESELYCLLRGQASLRCLLNANL